MWCDLIKVPWKEANPSTAVINPLLGCFRTVLIKTTESNALPLWHTSKGLWNICNQAWNSFKQISTSMESSFVCLWNKFPLTMWSPVTAEALASMDELGRTYLLNFSSPHTHDNCTISAVGPTSHKKFSRNRNLNKKSPSFW